MRPVPFGFVPSFSSSQVTMLQNVHQFTCVFNVENQKTITSGNVISVVCKNTITLQTTLSVSTEDHTHPSEFFFQSLLTPFKSH